MFCKSCGSNLAEKQPRFCPVCGCEHPTRIIPAVLSPVAGLPPRPGRRRLLWGSLAAAGIAASGGGAYWWFAGRPPVADANMSFSLDYPTDATTLDMFLEGDGFDLILQGGPYYLGSAQLKPQPILAAFRQLKQAKVAEAIGLSQAVFGLERKLQEDIVLLQEAMVDFWWDLHDNDPSKRKQGGELASLLVTDRLKLEGMLALYEGLPQSGSDMIQARNEYRRSMLTVMLAGAQARALAHVTAVALPLVAAHEQSEDEDIRLAVRRFEGRMDAMGRAAERLDQAQQKIALLATVLRQINTGEHYMGLASLEYARQLMPGIQSQLQQAAASGRLTSEDGDFMRDYLALQGRQFNGLEKSLKGASAASLLNPAELDRVKVSLPLSLMPLALAAGDSAWTRSIQALSMSASEVTGRSAGALSGSWQSIKTTYQDAKGAVGFGMDGVNAAVKSGFDYAIGKWEGNSDKDIRDTIAGNFAKMERNLVTGESGADVFEAAEDYFDALEAGGGDFAAAGVRTVLGDGNASWLAGHVGKVTVNMFTGFGKGVAKIANTRSTDGEVAEGFLDVGLSFIGGSKAVGKASQLLAGGRSGAKLVGKKGLGFLERMANKADLGKLREVSAGLLSKKKLTPGEIKKLISNAARIEANEALKQSLRAVNEAVNKKFGELLSKAAQTLKANASEGVKQSYKEFTQKVFKESLEGYRDALVTVLGNGLGEYIDNLVANKADDMIKVMVKEYIDRGIVELNEADGENDDECFFLCDEESKQRFADEVMKKGSERILNNPHQWIEDGARKMGGR